MISYSIYNIYLVISWIVFCIGVGLILLLLIKPLNAAILSVSILFFILSLFPLILYLYNKRQNRKVSIYIVNYVL